MLGLRRQTVHDGALSRALGSCRGLFSARRDFDAFRQSAAVPLGLTLPNERTLRPGEPAPVMIPTRRRSALPFWLEPLSQTLWRPLRQS